MKAVLENPYRIIGLLVGATAAEQRRQLIRLQKFLEADQEPEADFSFPTLGKIHRTTESVNDAASKLNLNNDKISAALFWFYKGNPITDEPAFDAIKEGDLDQVVNIWTKLTSNGEVSQRNASAYSNLGTLYLSGILEGTTSNEVILEQGVLLKMKFLESDFINEFKELATDETFRATKEELELMFLSQVQSEVEKSGIVTLNKFLEILTKQQFSAKEVFLKRFVQKPIEQIEKQIEETKKKAKANKSKAGEYGIELYDSTKTPLSQIKALLGSTDIKVVSISDKLANEILQCSITLFNHFHDTDTEVGEIALELNEMANRIALGSVIKQRINESTPIVEKYIKDRPTRKKQSIVSDDLKFITDKLENIQSAKDSISNAMEFANSCKPRLESIKLKLGGSDELYITISTAVASNTQGMIVSTVNEALEKRNKYVEYINYLNNPFRRVTSKSFGIDSLFDGLGSLIPDEVPFAPEFTLEELKKIISEAWTATVFLGDFDMSGDQRQHYNKNKASLLALYKQLNDGLVFFGDTPVQKWILWLAGIGLFILMISTCN